MKVIFTLLFGIVIFNGVAQQTSIMDQTTNEPISGVVVYNLLKSKSVMSDFDGKIDLDVFNANETIVFQHMSYFIYKAEKKDLEPVIYLVPKAQDLDEIVVSASKFEQSKRDLAQKVISIDAEKIQFTNPQTSADLLEHSGNIYIQKSQLGGGSPMIRGFSTNRLLITVDGVRMNNAIFRGGNLQNVISIDPFTIQNTEVTLGAGSVVYGSDAIGGVMSFYTKKPQPSYSENLFFKANAAGRYSTANNEKTGHLDLNFGLSKWAFLSSVSYTDFNDLRMGSHGPSEYLRPEYVEIINGEDVIVENDNPLVQKPTGYNQINLLQKVRYEPSENYSFDLGLYYTTTSNYPRYDRLIRYRGNNLRSAEWNYGPQSWFMTNLQVTKLSSNSSLYDKIHASAAYQNFQESRMDRNFQSEERSMTKEGVDALSFSLDLENELSSKTELFYGLEFVYNKIKSEGENFNLDTNESMAALSRYPNGSDWQSMAAYTSLKYKPNSNFVFQTGIRYNHIIANADFTENNVYLNLPFSEAKINAGAFTGTAGVSWMPNKTITWKLNASSAFRAPNMDDIGKVFDSEPGSVVVPNNNLKPEYAYGGELGLNLNFDKTFIIDVATYYTYLDNALVRRDYNINGETEIMYNGELSNVQAIQNASKAWIYGFEAGAQVNFSEYLKLTTQYNVIGGTEEDNGIEVPVRHAAPSFGNTHLVWQNNKLQVDAFAVYNDELSFYQLAPSERGKDYIYALDENGNPYSPSWYTLNLRTKYKITEAATVVASLENITDQRYKTYSSGIASPGRNLILSFQYSL
ncbi:MAG: TonB-dependent receptor [Flavobacteriaceae bacterium]|nr:TonB-dependent receptor [Flavobacteriaceae bacterium]